jgi:tetratricopeptide (TPR) repeat protein
MTTCFGRRHHLAAVLFLAMLVLLPYTQVLRHDYVDFDDFDYIVENPYVKHGFSTQGVWWAFNFRHQDKSYYRPLTWLSHMLDFEVWGAAPGYHHLVNVALHLGNAVLLYGVFFAMTGAWGPSVLVGALFGVHPINVESVAWLTERSNLLCTLFGLACMWAYVGYARQPTPRRYLATALAFTASLLAKPNLVTLPFLMLLLDYWPLGRWRWPERTVGGAGTTREVATGEIPAFSIGRLVVEKLPLITLSIAAIGTSILRLGSTIPAGQVPWELRLSNALVSYVRYLGNLFWPHNLAAFYPYPKSIPPWQAWGALTALAVISLLVLVQIRKRPYIFVGWFWFVGTFIPKIGLIQSGLWPALADRWAYFPAIGVFLLIGWWGGEVRERWQPSMKRLSTAAMALCLAGLAALTWVQVGTWSDSYTLLGRMLKLYPDNFMAHNNLGLLQRKDGRIREAEQHFREAIRINPGFEIAYLNLGNLAKERGDADRAMEWYRQALELNRNYAGAHLAIAGLYFERGAFSDAARHYLLATQIRPDHVAAINGLGAALTKMNRLVEAVALFEEALRIDPGFAPARENLAAVRAAMEQTASDLPVAQP